MNKVSISVIVPIYNVEKYIKRCMNSLVSQTFSDYEIVAVNDGTLDNSMDYVYELQKKYKNIVICERENGGLSAARNTGIAHAKGEYILFCDSDDALEENCLPKLYEEAKSKDLDMLLYDAETVWEIENEESVGENYYIRENICENVLTGEEMFCKLLKKKKFLAPAWLYLIKRDFLIKTDMFFYEGILHEDELFTPIVLTKAKRVEHKNWLIYKRCVREDSITTGDNLLKRMKSLEIVIQELVQYSKQVKSKQCAESLRELIIEHIKFFLGQTLLIPQMDKELRDKRSRVKAIAKENVYKLDIKFRVYLLYLYVKKILKI